MKATEQYFPVVLFIMLYKVILTFESVGEILKYDHSNESYTAVLSSGTVCFLTFCESEFPTFSPTFKEVFILFRKCKD